MKTVFAIALCLIPEIGVALTAAEVIAQAREKVSEADAVTAAASARMRLQALMTRYPDMQLGTKVETTSTQSTVLPVFIVPLEKLKIFNDTSKAVDVLAFTGRAYWQVFFPLEAGKPLVSYVEIMSTPPAGWTATRLGGATYAESVWKALEKADRPADAILVQIPSLALHFIAFMRENELMMSLISAAPGVPLMERKPERAEEVLLSLQPAAAAHNGQSA